MLVRVYPIKENFIQAQWFTPVISATQEVEIGRIVILGQPKQKVSKIPSKSRKGNGRAQL
jgi:hypothetical protein